MKKIIVLVLTFIVSDVAVAEYQLPEIGEIEVLMEERYAIIQVDRKCETLSGLAKFYMKSRQNEVSKDYQYSSVDKSKLPDDMKLKEKQIIRQAHEIPVFHAESDRKKIEVIFENNAFLECRKKGMGADWKLY
ncbi:hypothetical protein [Acinetobacter rudis]|uniref:hypothetical protein n=1 Tax=Acinetobacter rudis TaxID=632955 RepID=UPI003341E039